MNDVFHHFFHADEQQNETEIKQSEKQRLNTQNRLSERLQYRIDQIVQHINKKQYDKSIQYVQEQTGKPLLRDHHPFIIRAFGFCDKPQHIIGKDIRYDPQSHTEHKQLIQQIPEVGA